MVVFNHMMSWVVARNWLNKKGFPFGCHRAENQYMQLGRRSMGRFQNFRYLALGSALMVVLSALPLVPAQDDPDDEKRGVARISLINGEVSVRRGDSGEWVAAAANAPLMAEDRLSTGPNSRAEVQFDS